MRKDQLDKLAGCARRPQGLVAGSITTTPSIPFCQTQGAAGRTNSTSTGLRLDRSLPLLPQTRTYIVPW
jgi:hypothetical protein